MAFDPQRFAEQYATGTLPTAPTRPVAGTRASAPSGQAFDPEAFIQAYVAATGAPAPVEESKEDIYRRAMADRLHGRSTVGYHEGMGKISPTSPVVSRAPGALTDAQRFALQQLTPANQAPTMPPAARASDLRASAALYDITGSPTRTRQEIMQRNAAINAGNTGPESSMSPHVQHLIRDVNRALPIPEMSPEEFARLRQENLYLNNGREETGALLQRSMNIDPSTGRQRVGRLASAGNQIMGFLAGGQKNDEFSPLDNSLRQQASSIAAAAQYNQRYPMSDAMQRGDFGFLGIPGLMETVARSFGQQGIQNTLVGSLPVLGGILNAPTNYQLEYSNEMLQVLEKAAAQLNVRVDWTNTDAVETFLLRNPDIASRALNRGNAKASGIVGTDMATGAVLPSALTRVGGSHVMRAGIGSAIEAVTEGGGEAYSQLLANQSEGMPFSEAVRKIDPREVLLESLAGAFVSIPEVAGATWSSLEESRLNRQQTNSVIPTTPDAINFGHFIDAKARNASPVPPRGIVPSTQAGRMPAVEGLPSAAPSMVVRPAGVLAPSAPVVETPPVSFPSTNPTPLPPPPQGEGELSSVASDAGVASTDPLVNAEQILGKMQLTPGKAVSKRQADELSSVTGQLRTHADGMDARGEDSTATDLRVLADLLEYRAAGGELSAERAGVIRAGYEGTGASVETPRNAVTGVTGVTPDTPGAGDTPAAVKAPAPADTSISNIPTSTEGEGQVGTSVPSASETPAAPENGLPILVSTRDVDSTLARTAFSGTSFSPEKRGAAIQQDYVDHMHRVYALFQPYATTPEKSALLAEELQRYKVGYLQRLHAYLSAHGKTMSTMITGGSKFPVASNAKKMASADKRFSELIEWSDRAQQAMRKVIAPETSRMISSDDELAIEKLQAKIDKAEKVQEAMRGVNTILRKRGMSDADKKALISERFGFSEETIARIFTPDYLGRTGFADYELSNNNANIKRMRDRVSLLTKQRAETSQDISFTGGRVVDNVEDNRVQIFYDDKPDKMQLALLKGAGFKWAPSVGAWQRQRSNNATWAIKRITGVDLEAAPAASSSSDATVAPTFSQVEETPAVVVQRSSTSDLKTRSDSGSLNRSASEGSNGQELKTSPGPNPLGRNHSDPSQSSATSLPSSSNTRPGEPSVIKSTPIFNPVSIEETSARSILQPYATVKENLQAARVVQPAFDDLLSEITADLDDVRLDGSRLKVDKDNPNNPSKRLLYKVDELRKPPNTISDYLGGRLIVQQLSSFDIIASRMRERSILLDEKDKFDKPTEYGYRARHLQIRLPNGMSAEVQLVPQQLADLPGYHKLYSTGRDETDFLKQQSIQLQARAMAEPAYQEFLKRQQGLTGTKALEQAVSLARGKSDRSLQSLISGLPGTDTDVYDALQVIQGIRREYGSGQLTTPDKLRAEANRLDAEADHYETDAESLNLDAADEMRQTAAVLRVMADGQARESGVLFTAPAPPAPTGSFTQPYYRQGVGRLTVRFPNQEHQDLFNLARDVQRAEKADTDAALSAWTDHLDHLLQWYGLAARDLTRSQQERALLTEAANYVKAVRKGADGTSAQREYAAPWVVSEQTAAENMARTGAVPAVVPPAPPAEAPTVAKKAKKNAPPSATPAPIAPEPSKRPAAELPYRTALDALKARRSLDTDEQAWSALRTDVLASIRLGKPFNEDMAKKVGVLKPPFYRTYTAEGLIEAEWDMPKGKYTIGRNFGKDDYEEVAVVLMRHQYDDLPAFAVTERASGYTTIYTGTEVQTIRDGDVPAVTATHDPAAFDALVRRYLLPADETNRAVNLAAQTRMAQVQEEIDAEHAGVVISERIPADDRPAVAGALNSREDGVVIMPPKSKAGLVLYPVVTARYRGSVDRTALHLIEKWGQPAKRGGFAPDGMADDEDFVQAMTTPGASYNQAASRHLADIQATVTERQTRRQRTTGDVLTTTFPTLEVAPSRKDTDVHRLVQRGDMSASQRRGAEYEREDAEWTQHYSRVYVRNGMMASVEFYATLAPERWNRTQSATASVYTKTTLQDGVYQLTRTGWTRDDAFTPGAGELTTLLPSQSHGTLTINLAVFRELATTVLKYTAEPSDQRTSLTHVLLQVQGGVARLIATDTHRLIVRELPGIADTLQDGEYALTRTLIDLVAKERKSSGVTLRFGDETLTADTGTLIRVEHRGRGGYPSYERVVHSDVPTTYQLNTAELRIAITTVAPFVSDSGKIVVYATGDHLYLFAYDSAREVAKIATLRSVPIGATGISPTDDLSLIMPMQMLGGDLPKTSATQPHPAGIPADAKYITAGNVQYLRDAIDALRTEEVELGIVNELSPFTLVERGARQAPAKATVADTSAVPFPGALTTFDAHKPFTGTQRSSLPILSMALVRNGVMTSTDLSVAISTPTDLADGLYQLVSGKGHAEWVTAPYPAEEFPTIPTIADPHTATVDSGQFTRALKRALLSVSDDDARAVLKHVLFRVANDQRSAQVIATDGMTVTESTVRLQGDLPAGDYLIPAPFGDKQSLPALLTREQAPQTITLTVGDGKTGLLQVDDGNQQLITRLLMDTTYPTYDRVHRPISAQVVLSRAQVEKGIREIEKALPKPGKQDAELSIRLEPVGTSNDVFDLIGQSSSGETHRVRLTGTLLPGGARAHTEVTLGAGFAYTEQNVAALWQHSTSVFKRMVQSVQGEMVYFGITDRLVPTAEKPQPGFLTYATGIPLTARNAAAPEAFTDAEGEPGQADPGAPMRYRNSTQRPLTYAAPEDAVLTDEERLPIAPLPPHRNKAGEVIVKPLREIVGDLQLALGKALTVGKPGRGLAAKFDPSTGQVKMRSPNDLDTIAHEIAHVLDSEYHLVGAWAKPYVRSPYDGELGPFWVHGSIMSSGPKSTLRYKRAEGVAEYIRAWIVNPDAAEQAAPRFTKEVFHANVPAAARTALRAFGDDIRRWAGMTPIDQAMSNVQMTPEQQTPLTTIRDFLTIGKKPGEVTSWLDYFQAWLLNDWKKPFKKNVDRAAQIQGWDTPGHDVQLHNVLPLQDPTILLAKLDGFERDFNAFIEESVPALFKDFTLDQGDAVLEEQIRTMVAYGIAKRTMEKGAQWEREDHISGIGAGLKADLQQAWDIVDQVHADPALRAIVEKSLANYQKFTRGTLRYAVDHDMLTQEEMDRYIDQNEEYIAFYRLADETPPEASAVFPQLQHKQLGLQPRLFYKLTGAVDPLENPLIASLRQSRKIRYNAEKNAPKAALVRLLESDRGMYDAPMAPLSDIGYRSTEDDKHAYKVMLDGEAQYWHFEPGIHAVFTWGEKVLDPSLYSTFFKGLTTLLKAPVSIARGFALAMPDFKIRNIVRDTVESAINTKSGRQAWQFMGHITPEEIKEYYHAGGGQFGHYLASPTSFYKIIKDVTHEMQHTASGTKDRLISLDTLKKLLKQYHDLGEMSELKNRIAEYRANKALGPSLSAVDVSTGQTVPLDEANLQALSAFNARQLMDFAEGSLFSKFLDTYGVPFTNSSMVGMARSFQGMFSKNPRLRKRWWTKYIFYALIPTLCVWAWNAMSGNLDEYREMPAYLRDTFWLFKLPWPGGWLRIPKPFQAGVMASGAERALDYTSGNKDAFMGYGGNVGQSFMPYNVESSFWGPYKVFIEMGANYDLFRQRNIVPVWEKDKRVALRDTSRASRIGQAVQAASGDRLDARTVDFYLQEQFGGPGRYATMLTNPKGVNVPTGLNMITGLFTNAPGSNALHVQHVMDVAVKNSWQETPAVQSLRDQLKAFNAATEREKEAMRKDLLRNVKALSNTLDAKNTTADLIAKAHSADEMNRVLQRAGIEPLTDLERMLSIIELRNVQTKALGHSIEPIDDRQTKSEAAYRAATTRALIKKARQAGR